MWDPYLREVSNRVTEGLLVLLFGSFQHSFVGDSDVWSLSKRSILRTYLL